MTKCVIVGVDKKKYGPGVTYGHAGSNNNIYAAVADNIYFRINYSSQYIYIYIYIYTL
jgi:hypothetical protein